MSDQKFKVGDKIMVPTVYGSKQGVVVAAGTRLVEIADIVFPSVRVVKDIVVLAKLLTEAGYYPVEP